MNYGHRHFKISLLLSVIITLSLLCLNYALISDYYLLRSSSPLEEVEVSIIDPIDLSNDEAFIAQGTYTRRVMCHLYDFKIVMHNVDTHDNMLITKDNLLVSPPTNLLPGIKNPIVFEVKLPDGIYAGTWLPTFEGSYFCKKGIFMERKVQIIDTHAIIILD